MNKYSYTIEELQQVVDRAKEIMTTEGLSNQSRRRANLIRALAQTQITHRQTSKVFLPTHLHVDVKIALEQLEALAEGSDE